MRRISIEPVRNGWIIYEGPIASFDDANTAVHLTAESLIADLRGRVAVHSARVEKTELEETP